MTTIDVLTLFPEMFAGPFSESIIKNAQKKKIVKINISDIRDFAEDKHNTVDDKPYGGGAGMVMKVEPIVKAIESVQSPSPATNLLGKSPIGTRRVKVRSQKIVLLSARGKIFDQNKAKDLSKYKHLIFICGHYKGVDERIINFIDEELSIGKFILSGGEIPCMAVVDSIVRIIPGAISKEESFKTDSFWAEDLLSAPVYTRPESFRGFKVPKVLLSGNHLKIEKWRNKNRGKVK